MIKYTDQYVHSYQNKVHINSIQTSYIYCTQVRSGIILQSVAILFSVSIYIYLYMIKILIMFVCSYNPEKMAHLSQIFIRKIHLKYSKFENKAIFSLICN